MFFKILSILIYVYIMNDKLITLVDFIFLLPFEIALFFFKNNKWQR